MVMMISTTTFRYVTAQALLKFH